LNTYGVSFTENLSVTLIKSLSKELFPVLIAPTELTTINESLRFGYCYL